MYKAFGILAKSCLSVWIFAIASAAHSTSGVVYKNFLGMEFVNIHAGTFFMGSPESEVGRDTDEVLHRVTISQDYYLQTTEVTREQWKALLGGDPSAFIECGDQCAVNRVEVEWVNLFIEKLNRRDEKYDYRLPTEAEWEYAARAGTSTPFYTGECLSDKQANFRADIEYKNCALGARPLSPEPVRQYPPNAWGLYDMYGSVWELCSDWYGEYSHQPVVDPKGPAEGKYYVKRGGSWFNNMAMSRSAQRSRTFKSIAGFRLVAEPKAVSINAVQSGAPTL